MIPKGRRKKYIWTDSKLADLNSPNNKEKRLIAWETNNGQTKSDIQSYAGFGFFVVVVFLSVYF